MNKSILTFNEIAAAVKPIAQKYQINEVYMFGSYARGEADGDSDIDFYVIGGQHFDLCSIFAFAEDLRYILHKDVDAFEMHEINQDSQFYKAVMREKVRVA